MILSLDPQLFDCAPVQPNNDQPEVQAEGEEQAGLRADQARCP